MNAIATAEAINNSDIASNPDGELDMISDEGSFDLAYALPWGKRP
jgi:hypothetical protein